MLFMDTQPDCPARSKQSETVVIVSLLAKWLSMWSIVLSILLNAFETWLALRRYTQRPEVFHMDSLFTWCDHATIVSVRHSCHPLSVADDVRFRHAGGRDTWLACQMFGCITGVFGANASTRYHRRS